MLLVPREVIKRDTPENINKLDLQLFRHELEKEFEAVYLMENTNITITEQGYLYKNFRVIKETLTAGSNRSIRLRVRMYIDLIKSLFSSEKIVLSNTYYVVNVNSDNYFHWHLDVLPKIELLNRLVPNAVVALPKKYNKGFYKKITTLYPALEFKYLGKKTLSKTLNFLPDLAPSGNYRTDLISKVAVRLQQLPIRSMQVNKVYISRKKANNRKILNEDDILDELIKLGFTVLYMEDLHYEEQIAFLKSADVLVSLHGAGLTNMIHMQPRAKVVEIRAKGDALNNCYFSLSSSLKHRYFYLFAEPIDKNASTQRADFLLGKNFINNLIEILKK